MINYTLKKRPKNPIIIEGFPGFGLVGTISTGFLIDHLGASPIGYIWSSKLTPMVAIHGGNVIKPLEIFYNKKYNIIIINALANVSGLEWDVADAILKLAEELRAKEIISIEGVGSTDHLNTHDAYYYTNVDKKKLEKSGAKPLKEGIVLGVTSALISRSKKTNLSCVFAESHSGLPDSKAAAKVIEVLDKYLGLKVDYKPLIKKAEEFEGKLKNLIEKNREVMKSKGKQKLSYLG